MCSTLASMKKCKPTNRVCPDDYIMMSHVTICILKLPPGPCLLGRTRPTRRSCKDSHATFPNRDDVFPRRSRVCARARRERVADERGVDQGATVARRGQYRGTVRPRLARTPRRARRRSRSVVPSSSPAYCLKTFLSSSPGCVVLVTSMGLFTELMTAHLITGQK